MGVCRCRKWLGNFIKGVLMGSYKASISSCRYKLMLADRGKEKEATYSQSREFVCRNLYADKVAMKYESNETTIRLLSCSRGYTVRIL